MTGIGHTGRKNKLQQLWACELGENADAHLRNYIVTNPITNAGSIRVTYTYQPNFRAV